MNSNLSGSQNTSENSEKNIKIGIIQSNAKIPYPSGSVGNPKSFPFETVYYFVEELTTQRLIIEADTTLTEPIIQAAKALEQVGVSAIMGDCGHLIQFQKMVKSQVDIPVLLSSWLQIPFINSILSSHQRIGVIMANKKYFRRKFLTHAGIDESIELVIVGMESQPAFKKAYINEPGELVQQAVQNEMINAAKSLRMTHPEIGAIFLECSDMPPYSKDIRQITELPVFDYLTMAKFVFSTIT